MFTVSFRRCRVGLEGIGPTDAKLYGPALSGCSGTNGSPGCHQGGQRDEPTVVRWDRLWQNKAQVMSRPAMLEVRSGDRGKGLCGGCWGVVERLFVSRYREVAQWRRRLPMILVAVLAMASCLATVSAAQAAVNAAGGFTSVAPVRLLDTRGGLGAAQAAVAPAGTVSLQVAGQGGVPASGVAAVVLNVTVAEPTGAGCGTVYG